SYAWLLKNYRGWPGETALRQTAERAIDYTTPAADVVSYFRIVPPLTATGHARYAFALYNMRQTEQANSEAREAWRSGVLQRGDEDRLLSLFYAALSPTD